ncbi:MAG: hypothetical protein WCE20_06135 [Rhizomicrobium sp.]
MIVRVGRVLFWFGVVAAVMFGFGGVFRVIVTIIAFSLNGMSYSVTGQLEEGLGLVGLAAIAFGLGKSARYILANE